MAYEFQIAVDCAQPHVLADWWAETLGWLVEQQNPDFIRRMIAEGYATEAETSTHNGALVWTTGAAIHHPGDQQDGPRRRIIFQQVPEGNQTVPKIKNKLHLDLRIGEDEVDAVVTKLIESGATFLWNGQQGPHRWVTLADPEGNEFCVSQ